MNMTLKMVMVLIMLKKAMKNNFLIFIYFICKVDSKNFPNNNDIKLVIRNVSVVIICSLLENLS